MASADGKSGAHLIASVALALSACLAPLMLDLGAQEPGVPGVSTPCRVSGRVVSGTTPLPGVAVTVRLDGVVAAATSTDPDGRYELVLPPGIYAFRGELTGFDPVDRPLEMQAACVETLDLQFSVTPPAARGAGPGATGQGGRGGGRGRFEALAIAQAASAPVAGGEAVSDTETGQETPLALPPGFSTDGPTDAVAVTGNAANVDRGLLNDRLDALNRGEFGPPVGDGGRAGGPFPGGGAGPGFAGAPGQRGLGGGPGGRGFAGRGGVQPPPYSFSAGYTFGGSVLDAAPHEVRSGDGGANPDYLRQNADVSFGGPLKLPGLYDGTRRTNLTFTYTRNSGSTLFDQYSTVPTDAMRGGDLSALGTAVIDPETGLAFPGNQIPADRIDPSAGYLLQFLPSANLPGTARNFRYVTTTDAATDNMNLRVTHNFTPGVAGAGGRGGFGGRGGGGGGGAGRGAQAGTSAVLTAQLQYRRNDNERNNVFPTLGGVNTGSSVTVPVTLNVARGRMLHSITTNISRTWSDTANQYAFTQDVTGDAGIVGVANYPFAWGVPTLSFASATSVNDLAPASRTDTRTTLGYTWSRPIGSHTLRAGGEWRRDRTSGRTDANANGTFLFTGLYSGNDVADFLLGAPQQASVQYGPGMVNLNGRSFSLFVQDDWRRSANLTFNLGLRYELTRPLVETGGRLVNLDVAPDFTAAVPVTAGDTGPYSGTFPDGLIRTDINNLAPRLGVAWRGPAGTVVRGGYGVSFNNGSYPALARQLSGQPPFSVVSTAIGTVSDPLALADSFAAVPATDTMNNFGVAIDYQLGRVQTWNVDVSRNLAGVWNAGAGYTYARGSGLDLVRAPNRGPFGLRIEGVQPFLWQTSESSSRLHSATFRLRRRAVRGVGGGVTYTLARSMDDASTIGGGAVVVAQNDQDLEAEWGLSSFDRRHQLSGTMNVELPFGPNRRWLSGGGVWAALLQAWSANFTVTAQSGTPLTARVLSAAGDAARGTNGTLRADYNGDPIALSSPTVDRFFNTAAFSRPAPGTFGSAGRNIIIGPASRDLSAQFSRDISLTGTRSLTIQLRATNLLNLVNYGAVDTVVNSPSFGQVTSVRPARSMQLILRFRY